MSLLETWNEGAAQWLDVVWRSGIATTVAALVVALVWLVVRRWSSAHLGYALFLIPLVLLVVPIPRLAALDGATPLRIASIGTVWPELVGRSSEAPSLVGPREATSALRPSATVEGALDLGPRSSPVHPDPVTARSATEVAIAARAIPQVNDSLSPSGALLALWAIVVTALLGRFVVNQLRTHGVVRRARDLEIDALPPEIRAAMRPLIRDRARLAESDELHGPAVWGVWSPTLVLPTGLIEELDPQELRWVLSHELAHIRRHDVAIAGLQRLLQILWFFHPVVWLVGRQVDRWRECACDEMALSDSDPGSRRGFAEALVRLAARPELGPRSTLPVQGLLGPKSLLETRVLRMIDSKRTIQRGLGLLALPVLLLTGGSSVLAAAAIGQDPAPSEQPRVAQDDESSARGAADTAQEKSGGAVVTSTSPSLEAVSAGIRYLESTQAEDGGWWAGQIEAVTEGVNLTVTNLGHGGEFNRAGVTGLALMALFEGGAAESEQAKRGLAYLVSVQDEIGCFGGRDSALHNASHAMATLAYATYHADDADAEVLAVTQKAVGFLEKARNPYGGWRFSYPPDGDNDTFVTSLCLRALVKARELGCKFDDDAVTGGLRWLDEMTDRETGRCGYSERGGPAPRLALTRDTHPATWSEMPTSMALLARLALGQLPEREPEIVAGAKLVAQAVPVWSEEEGSIDYYHWLFGTDALRQIGGDEYARWKKKLDEALLPHQDEDGSWPAIDAWSTEGARVHATALNTWTLAITNR